MNNYHIYEEVGRGKYSVVYKGRIKKSIKYVAVKSVERSRRKKLMNEVRIFHDLQHRNILKFYNWYETRNHLWIIFEYCAGGDLCQLVETDKKLTEETVRKFGIELLEGLSYLHSNSIIYSDLKPANILLNEYGVLKLCDFGLSKKIQDLVQPDNDPAKPKAGTPYYMAPELFQDNGYHSFYSDFWSLGCLLFELATGKPPFCTNSLKDLIALIVTADFPRVDGFSQEFNDLLRKLLDKDPIKRINWEELKNHNFWQINGKQYEFVKRAYPKQPQFDIYLKSRGIVPEHFYDQRNNTLAKIFQVPSDNGLNKVDILRLSHNVRRNIIREEEDTSNKYGNNSGNNTNENSNNNNTLDAQEQFLNFSKNMGNQLSSAGGAGSNMAIVGAAALMMVGAGGNNSSANQGGNQQQSETNLQINEDDISLGNRRVVLNFGEKDDDLDNNESSGNSNNNSNSSSAYKQQQSNSTNPDSNGSGNSTPSHHHHHIASAGSNIDSENSSNHRLLSNERIQQQQHQPVINNIFQKQRGSDGNAHSNHSQKMYQSDSISQQTQEEQAIVINPQLQKKGSAGYTHSKQPPQKQHSANITLQSPNGNNNLNLIDQTQMNNTTTSSFLTKQNHQAQSANLSRVLQQNQTNQFDMLNQQNQMVGAMNNLGTYMTSNTNNSNTSGFGNISSNNQQQLQVNQLQNQQNQNANQQAKIPYKTIDQLLIHNSDSAVKPIIGNKEIEKQVEAIYDSNMLPFIPWTPDQVLQKIDTQQIEGHLNELYNSIASNTHLNEKINALLYFESIIINSSVSNRLINSAFMNLLVKMMKTIKTPQIRIRLCSVIGLLIRHSTVIENELAESDICNQLIEIMKDKNEKVRKKAIAALGEYMFYAATQLDDEQADSCWEISDEAINVIVRSLRDQEDETVRFYACKTLENITAQSNSAGDRFATPEAVTFLLQIFLPGSQQMQVNDNMRISAAVALSHICKLQARLFPLIFNKITPRIFCYTLTEGQSRVQQALITMLNQALYQNTYPKINEVLLNEESFLKSLIRLIEHQSIVIRGKVLLTFLLLFRQDFRWMAMFDPEVKFFHVLDRLSRDNYKYVQCCLQCLVVGIDEIMPIIFQTIQDELNILLHGGRAASPSEFDKKISRSEFESLQGNLVYIAIILDLQQAQIVKNRIVKYEFIRNIASLIDVCDIYSFTGAEEFLHALLLINENLSSNQKILLQMNEPILNFMLRVLLSKIESESADIRFLSLKIFTDIIIQYLNDDSIYDIRGTAGNDNQITENGNNVKLTTKFINDLLFKDLFPMFKLIFQDKDPVPLFGLKLLSAIVERNPVFIQLFKKFDLVRYISDNFVVNHSRLNRHTINILKSMIESKELTFQELAQYKIIDKTHAIIKNMLANKQDWCTEILLDIIHELLSQFMEVVKTKENEISKLIDELFNNFDICVQLLNLQFEITIVEKASQCLIQMLQLYAMCQKRQREIYFVESHLPFLISALEADKKIIQKRVLKCVYWALVQSEYQIKLKSDKKNALEKIIAKFLQSEDRSIYNTSDNIYKILTERPLQTPQQQQPGMYMGDINQGSNQQMNFYHNLKQQ